MRWLILLTLLIPVNQVQALELADVRCLAEAIWRESRGESLQGQIAVGKVVLNRVAHSGYPNTVCKVVFQPYQFSWTKGWKSWRYDYRSLLVASMVLAGNHGLKNFKATHFHSGPQPDWAKTKKIYKKIGNHVFYK